MTRRQRISATLAGPDLENAEFIQRLYGFGHLGMTIRPAMDIAARVLRGQNPELGLPSPTPRTDGEALILEHDKETSKETPTQPKLPIDWAKGDSLSDVFPQLYNKEKEPEPPAQEPIQSLVDAVLEPMPTQRPKPLDLKTITPYITPKLKAANQKMLKKIYVLDNYYHDGYGTENDCHASTSWMESLLQNHDIKSNKALDIIEAHLKKMKSHPDWAKRWARPNPRWPQADALVGIGLKSFEI